MNGNNNQLKPSVHHTNTILYAEDDESYALLLECTLKQVGFSHTLRVVGDGSEAMKYLKGDGKYADRSQFPMPNVVLADLKMPRVNGFELLSWIRKSSPCPHVPVVVLTCSDEFREIQEAYRMGANSFLIKPPHVEDLKELLNMLNTFWLRHSR
jgi:CheY-like chemotaxis protein